ncbi:MAG: hypothetical protein R2834_13615 [Rhodothermales bacterium]
METPAGDSGYGFPFEALNDLRVNLESVDWERELKRVGALAGSVVGSFVSSRMALSLGMRIVTVVGGSYGGAIAVTLAYEAWRYFDTRSGESEEADPS